MPARFSASPAHPVRARRRGEGDAALPPAVQRVGNPSRPSSAGRTARWTRWCCWAS